MQNFSIIRGSLKFQFARNTGGFFGIGANLLLALFMHFKPR